MAVVSEPRHQRSQERAGGSPGWTLFVVCLATALLLLNVSAPNVALPTIAEDLGADFSDTQLIISAYALTLAALLLTGGTLADLYGRRRMFLYGLAGFALTSLACALSPSPVVLIASRAGQGASAAVLFSSALSLLAQEFEGAARGRALGIWGATVSAAFAIGPLEGGLLTDGLGWHWIFLVNVLLAVPAGFIALRKLRESSDPGSRGVDWLGVALLSPALAAGVFALVRGNALGWTSAAVLGLLAASVALGVAFVVHEGRREEPMLDLALFRIPTFTGASLVCAALAVSTFAPILYVSLFLLNIVGSSPPVAGLQLAPFAGVAFVTSIVVGRQSGRLPVARALAVGLGLCAVGLMLMRGVSVGSSWTELLPGYVVGGLGIGIANPFVTFAALGVVPTARSGTAAGVNNTFRQLGIAGGIAALGAILQRTIQSDVADRITGTPAADGRPGVVAQQVGAGDVGGALASLPRSARGALQSAYDQAFVGALNELLLIAAGVALAGAVVALVLMRDRDFIVAR
jgi:EmrB/QacA subfamily drug resistance transporter